MRKRIKEWLWRYAPAEILSIISIVISATILTYVFNLIIVSAFISTWIGNIVYYGIIIFNDLNGRNINLITLIKQTRNLIVEFGPAEYLDSFIIRPFFLSVTPYFIPNYPLAIFIGTNLANITFYIPTIISYELKKRIFKD